MMNQITASQKTRKTPENTRSEARGSESCGHPETTPQGQQNLNELLSGNPQLWRGCDMAGQGDHGLPTGYPELDAILPGRGWPRNALVEIISPHWGMGELQLLIPLMRSVVEQNRWILWISPPYLLYAPALIQAGIDIGKVLVVQLNASCKDALWSMEKALQTESCGLVLAWQNWLPGKVVRRLQLAAQTGKTLGVLFHRHVSNHSQSSLRLKIQDSSTENGLVGNPHINTEIAVIRARGNFRPLSARLNLRQ
jgi:hypothetical protein